MLQPEVMQLSLKERIIMKSIAIALAAILICLAIGSALGNPGGGFVVGIVFAIMLAKRYGTLHSTRSA